MYEPEAWRAKVANIIVIAMMGRALMAREAKIEEAILTGAAEGSDEQGNMKIQGLSASEQATSRMNAASSSAYFRHAKTRMVYHA